MSQRGTLYACLALYERIFNIWSDLLGFNTDLALFDCIFFSHRLVVRLLVVRSAMTTAAPILHYLIFYVFFPDGCKVARGEVWNECGSAYLEFYVILYMLFLQTVERFVVVRSGMNVVAPILHFMLYCICYFYRRL